MYEQTVVRGEGDRPETYDSDGDELNLETFTVQLFEFLLTIVSNPRLGPVRVRTVGHQLERSGLLCVCYLIRAIHGNPLLEFWGSCYCRITWIAFCLESGWSLTSIVQPAACASKNLCCFDRSGTEIVSRPMKSLTEPFSNQTVLTCKTEADYLILQMIEGSIGELVYYAIGYMCMTEEQTEACAADPNQYVADEEEETFSCRNSGEGLPQVFEKVSLI